MYKSDTNDAITSFIKVRRNRKLCHDETWKTKDLNDWSRVLITLNYVLTQIILLVVT